MTNERLKVLIIDDEKDLCLLIKAYLSRKNCEVHTAYTLTEGLQQVAQFSPDILFLDNNLPDGLGWEKAENIIQQYPNIQLHLLSAFNPSQTIVRLPVTRVWEKPNSLRGLDKYFS